MWKKADSFSENGASVLSFGSRIEKRTRSAFCTEEAPNAGSCDLQVLGI